MSTQLPLVQLEDIKETHNKHELTFLSKLHSILSQVSKKIDREEMGNNLVKNALTLVHERF
jgi:hypothetical protein